MSKEVRAQLHLSLFGTKISLSLSPEDEDHATGTELAKSSEDARAGNVDDPSFSPSSSGSDDEKARPTTEKEALAKQSEQQADTRTSNKPQLKRPDKPVACPRCNSLDTKFCYYNNYNVNQPRHFCKNCQRYWTAGGTLRNVPVGAGRRKNKGGRGDGIVPRAGNGNGTMVQESNKVARPGCKRSLDITTSESPMVRQRKGGGACSEETGSLGRSISCGSDGSSDSRDDSTCASSVSNPVAQESKGCFQGILPGAVSNSAPDNGRAGLWHGLPWPVPAWCPAGWNATWNTPWGNLAATAASAAARALADNVGSLQRRHQETTPNRGLLWAPKTLRINARAGNNTFFADIGTGTKVESISTGGMFKAFHQENSSTQTTLTTTSESGEVEESKKASNSGPTVTA